MKNKLSTTSSTQLSLNIMGRIETLSHDENEKSLE